MRRSIYGPLREAMLSGGHANKEDQSSESGLQNNRVSRGKTEAGR
jgi:hypothetical protein